MQVRSLFIRCAAFCLILVFSQKTGGGLFLHNLLHANAGKEAPQQQNKNKNEINYACSCIDDFLAPFAGEAEIISPAPVVRGQIVPVSFFQDRIPFRSIILSSLRGPPADC